MMDKVRIKRNNSGDSRTAKGVPTFEEFHNANQMHIDDVARTMSEVGWEILHRGGQHDVTKTILEEMFYRDMVDTIENGTEFTEGQWAKIHYFDSCERHHLHRHVPDDVNIIDVIEMICDCLNRLENSVSYASHKSMGLKQKRLQRDINKHLQK